MVMFNIDHLKETVPLTGKEFGPPPSPVTSWTLKQTLVLDIIGPFAPLRRIMRKLLRSLGPVTFIGASLEPVSHDEHGMKRDFQLIVKIPARSFGVDIEINQMLLLMSFEEVLTSHTCLDGQTAIRSKWRLKAVPGRSWLV